jgi:beta-phosphoglucomutase-like phosphatase (HAD superfamily)
MRGIIFDCDGVVIDTESIWDEAQVELLGRRGLPYDRATLKPLMTGRIAVESIQVMIDHCDMSERAEDLAVERYDIYHRLLPDRVRYLPGFEEFFDRVIRGRFPAAVGTSMSEKTLAVVDDRVRLRDRFGPHLYTVEAAGGRSKPEPDVFLHAAAKLGLKASDCVVLEDSPAGVEAGLASGAFTIGLASTLEPRFLSRAHAVAADYSDLERLLRDRGLV